MVRQKIRQEASILVLGSHGSTMSNLAERVRRMGFPAVRAKSPQHAMDLAEARSFRFRVALVEPDIPAVDLGDAFEMLRLRSKSMQLTFIAVGDRPDAEFCERLRAADVQLALWTPIGDHALRFQINRALAPASDGYLRAEERVPTEWRACVSVGGREKPASVYSLSSGGAFLETSRPSLTGARVNVELPLPGGSVHVEGSVLYTNVPGNLNRGNLPHGMAIRFQDSGDGTLKAIRRSVDSFRQQLVV